MGFDQKKKCLPPLRLKLEIKYICLFTSRPSMQQYPDQFGRENPLG